ncbi:PH domain-containing protein [Myxococcaceae bacterium GXIMD 01537]
MIAALVAALRPLYLPLLKLRLEPPTLPEGTTAVRTLKPSGAYLTYRYLGVLALSAYSLLVAAAVGGALIVKLGWTGVAIAAPVGLLVLGGVGLQLVVVRVDWELRDYLIGDRSLRLREGAFVQREVTLSYANVQNVEVTQGPLERLFGFKTLRVSTAGGRAPAPGKAGQGTVGHDARLVGLENAEEVRELVLQALRAYRGAGLGDPDDARAPTRSALLSEVREAARELREAAEARRYGG